MGRFKYDQERGLILPDRELEKPRNLQPRSFMVGPAFWGSAPSALGGHYAFDPTTLTGNSLLLSNTEYYNPPIASAFRGVCTSTTIQGKTYAEFVITSLTGNSAAYVGVADYLNKLTALNTAGGGYAIVSGAAGFCGITNGTYQNGAYTTNSAYTFAQGAVIGVAFDPFSGNVWFSINGSWIGNNPSTGLNPTFTVPIANDAYFFKVGDYTCQANGTTKIDVRYAASQFSYPIPTGFAAYQQVFNPPLDSYTTSLWGTYGLQRMLTSWTGAVLRVHRSSDGAEQDIGYDAFNLLDLNSLLTFVGTGSGYVSRWYDQSGAGNDFIQATAAQQPRIVNAGNYDNKIVFNPGATVNCMQTANLGAATAAKSIFRKVNARALTTNATEFEYGDSNVIGFAGGANQFALINQPSPNQMGVFMAQNASGSAYNSELYNNYTETGESVGCIFLKGQPTIQSTFYVYGKGAVQTSTFQTGLTSVPGTFPQYKWGIGARNSALVLPAQIDMWSCAIYDADMSSSALGINAKLLI